uniref:Uncharacterized protein n=1 Tax=Rhizophora mucronata TaxID=61149 RepID=A0A2P2Q199_RHIMU
MNAGPLSFMSILTIQAKDINKKSTKNVYSMF